MKEKPLVSICIPTYNGEAFLSEALDSAKKQTYSNLEFIISDDHSQDETLRIIERFKKDIKFPVNIFSHKPDGIGSNWNNCVSKSNGKYIKFLFQDDVLSPTCVEEMVNIAEKDKGIGLVFSKRGILSDSMDEKWLEKYGDLPSYWSNLKEIQEGKHLLRDKKLLCQPMNKIGEPSVVLLKKEVFNNVGLFRKDLKQKLDYEFWFRVMTKFKVGYLDKELSYFRIHKNQATSKFRDSFIQKRIEEKFFYSILLKYILTYLHPQVKFLLKLKIFLYKILITT